MQRLRLPGLPTVSRWFSRLQRSQDTPPAPAETATPALITQDPPERSAEFAQSLFEGGGLKAGQTVLIEGQRPMTVTVEDGRVVLVPLAPGTGEPTADASTEASVEAAETAPAAAEAAPASAKATSEAAAG